MDCPSTPTSSQSSFASSSSSSFQTPPPLGGTSSSSSRSALVTPPSSPSLGPQHPLTPSSSSTRTLHLRSPCKPSVRAQIAGTALAPTSTQSPRRDRPPLPSSHDSFTVRGNVTPSRASAFFAPRRSTTRPSQALGASSPGHAIVTASSHTSARRGVKRRRDGDVPTSPSAGRQRSDRMILSSTMGSGAVSQWDESDDSDEDELVALPRRARQSSPLHGFDSNSSWSLPDRQSKHQAFEPASPNKPIPLALRSRQTGNDLASALANMRCGAGGGGSRIGRASTALRSRISQAPAYQTFGAHPEHSVYTTGNHHDDQLTQPLSCAYSYSSKSYASTRQWLAVGDNVGKLSLIDTSRDQTLDSFTGETDDFGRTAGPSWSATSGSLFSLSWRFDDRYIASSGSDYSCKIWDTATFQAVNSFSGSRGTARCIEWDPDSQGHLLASGGRDGAVHVYDLRMADGVAAMSLGAAGGPDDDQVEDTSALLSLWSAHAPILPPKTRRTNLPSARGVTSIVYDRIRPHSIFTAGCADATVKLWDLRFAVDDRQRDEAQGTSKAKTSSSSLSQQPSRIPFTNLDLNISTAAAASSSRKRKPIKPKKARPGDPSIVLNSRSMGLSPAPDDDFTEGAAPPTEAHGSGLESDPLEIRPIYETGDLSTTRGKLWNARSHGISSLVAGSGGGSGHSSNILFAACTDGRIYQMDLAWLSPGSSGDLSSIQQQETGVSTSSPAWIDSTTVLYHPSQLGNSLYNRLSMCPDDRTLALGCNNGSLVLWDTAVGEAAVLSSTLGASMDLDDEEAGTAANFGHHNNSEINALDWCYDAYAGWRLATAGDDLTIRVWEQRGRR